MTPDSSDHKLGTLVCRKTIRTTLDGFQFITFLLIKAFDLNWTRYELGVKYIMKNFKLDRQSQEPWFFFQEQIQCVPSNQEIVNQVM